MTPKQIHEAADRAFGKRTSLLLLWQDMAENFYPERADFTYQRSLGMEFASNLMTSYPLMCRRELGDQIGQMLRPTAKVWAHIAPVDPGRENNESRRWMEWAANTQRRAMYDPDSLFSKATKQADNDFACFGQTVMSIKLNRYQDTLLYQTWHLRDCAWTDNEDGKVGAFYRKWKPTCRDLERLFKNKIHPKVKDLLNRNKGFEEITCMHFVVDADMWDGDARGMPKVSIWWDCDNNHAMEETPTWNKEYIVPRWSQVSGSQYAFSPATVAALPEARLLQSMTYTLLEAGEKMVNPPMVATHEAVRSDVNIYAGGITWVDRDYDERLGDALRPMTIDKSGMPIGQEMQTDSRQMILQAFYLNKLNLPQRAPEMTAYEVAQRIQEYIRGALPLFEPMEAEYNGQLMDVTFDLMRRAGGFGSPMDMPKILQDAKLQYRFESPLHDAIDAIKGQKFIEANQIVAQGVQLDPSVAAMVDMKVTVRDVLNGIGVPAKWLRDEVEVEDIEAQQKAQAQAQQTLATMQQGADVAATMATAQKENAAAQGAMV